MKGDLQLSIVLSLIAILFFGGLAIYFKLKANKMRKRVSADRAKAKHLGDQGRKLLAEAELLMKQADDLYKSAKANKETNPEKAIDDNIEANRLYSESMMKTHMSIKAFGESTALYCALANEQ